MVLSQNVDSKELRMVNLLKYFDEQKANWRLKKYKFWIFFFFAVSFEIPEFKVFVFARDLEFCIEVNEDIPTQNLLPRMGSSIDHSSMCQLNVYVARTHTHTHTHTHPPTHPHTKKVMNNKLILFAKFVSQ